MAVGTDQLQDNVLSANGRGRAKMQTQFFDGATVDDKFQNESIPATKIGQSVQGGVTTKTPKVKVIDSATVKALLDGVANTLTLGLPVGTLITDFIIWSSTAAGGAGTVKVGTDANWNVANDDDAFVAAHDLNAQGTYKMSMLDAGSTPVAPSAGNGVFASDTADLTIESSADLSASSWVGGIAVFYI